MITRLLLENFKSFAGEDHNVRIGPLTLVVGTNASGKSNLRDALRFLHGVARGYTLAEILGEKYGEGGVLQWKGIRGGVREAVHGVEGGKFELGIDCAVTHRIKIAVNEKGEDTFRSRRWFFRYRIEVIASKQNNTSLILNEELKTGTSAMFSTFDSYLKSDQLVDGRQILVRYRNPSAKKYIGPTIKLRREQPLVSQLAEHPDVTATTRNACRLFLGSLESMRFLDLDPQSLRRPSLPGQVVLGDKGENLSSVLQALCEDPTRKESLIEWTRELTPLDVVDFKFPAVSLEGRIQLVLVEQNGLEISAESASDGTLRFLAFAAALLGTRPAETYIFEEIENGIHPNRVHLLLELLRRSTGNGATQVLATTHSPALLNFLRDQSLDDSLVVTRQDGSSVIHRFGDLPITDRDRSKAGDLLEAGWFETVLAFIAANEREEAE